MPTARNDSAVRFADDKCMYASLRTVISVLRVWTEKLATVRFTGGILKRIPKTITFLLAMGLSFGLLLPSASARESELAQPETSLNGKIIFLDAGHGEGTGGKDAFYTESEEMLRYALLVRERLESCGATVVMTRETQADIDNYARAAMINASSMRFLLDEVKTERRQIWAELDRLDARCLPTGEQGTGSSADETAYQELSTRAEEADRIVDELWELISLMDSVAEEPALADGVFLSPYSTAVGRPISQELESVFVLQKERLWDRSVAISLHSNAPGHADPTKNGTIVFYMDNAENEAYFQGYPEEKSRMLATRLSEEVAQAGAFKSNGIRENDYYFVREINLPAALVEIAYHTNESDRCKLTDPTVREQIADGIVRAIAGYFAEDTVTDAK